MATQKPLVLVSGTVQEMASTDAVSAATTLKQNVMNQSGSTMVLGAAVYVSSANGDNPVVSLAQANSEATSSKTLGLLETSIANGGSGNVVQNGFIVGLNTSTATIGDPVWLSPSVAGGLVYGTANKPVAPNHMVFIGKVVRVHANQGTILVNVQNGFEIEELHNVLITSLTDGNDLTYEAASGLWKNKAKPASGIAVSTGTAWGTSLTAPTGTIVGTTDTQTLTNKTINSSSIGATTPSTGAFTTLSASGTTTLSGGTANGIAYLNGSKAVSTSSNFTYDDTNVYLAGSLGIGTTGVSSTALGIESNITGGINSFAVNIVSTVLSDVTTAAYGYRSSLSTQASAFTLAAIHHYRANQSTIGAGSTVTNQYGFNVDSTLTGATNNYGFYGNIASGTGRYNLYMAGTADNYLAGGLGIGSTNLTSTSLRVESNVTGNAYATGIASTGITQSDVTSECYQFFSRISTAANSFSLVSAYHYVASQSTIGAGSVVTNQYGYMASSNLIGTTHNYGFYGNIAAPTSGISTTGTISSISSSGTTVTVNHSAITYTDGQTVTISATANATALVSGCTCTILTVGTTDFTLIGAANNNVGTSFTATGAGTGTGTVTLNIQGSGKTVAGAASGSFTYTTTTSQTFAAVTVLTGSVIVSKRYNLYMAGTADNWFSGNVRIGGAGGLGYTTGSGGAVTQATSRTTGVTLNKTNGAITLVSAAGSASYQSFTVTNSTVAATDTIIINQQSGTDIYEVFITAVAAGSFRVTFATTGGTTTEQPVFNFAVIKAVTA